MLNQFNSASVVLKRRFWKPSRWLSGGLTLSQNPTFPPDRRGIWHGRFGDTMGSRMDEEKTSAFRALQDDERRLLKHC